MSRRYILALSVIAIISIAATVAVIVTWADHSDTDHISSGKNIDIPSEFSNSVTPFTNVAEAALIDGYEVWNDRPGIAVFDYDRDGDHDIYITSEFGHPNWLYNNQGDGTFLNMAAIAGVTSESNNSTGVVACDINNDGYQDLYVGSWGLVGDRLDFRSHLEDSFSRDIRSEEHTSELQSRTNLVCRLLLEKKKSTRLNSALNKVQGVEVMVSFY